MSVDPSLCTHLVHGFFKINILEKPLETTTESIRTERPRGSGLIEIVTISNMKSMELQIPIWDVLAAATMFGPCLARGVGIYPVLQPPLM